VKNNNSQKYKESKELYEQAKQLFPYGTQLFSRRPELGAYGQAPIYFEKMKDAHFWDVDGNEFIDTAMGVGPVILGHGYKKVDDAVKESLELQNSLVSPFVTFAKVILIVTAVVAVLFSVWNLIKHPKLLKKTLLSIGVLAVLLAIAYMMADDGETLNTSGLVLKDGEAGSTSKWVSTGIWYSLILGGAGLVGVLWDFVKSIVSK